VKRLAKDVSRDNDKKTTTKRKEKREIKDYVLEE